MLAASATGSAVAKGSSNSNNSSNSNSSSATGVSTAGFEKGNTRSSGSAASLYPSAAQFAAAVPTSTPKFSTPSLDFAMHSRELRQLIDQIHVFRDTYYDRVSAATDAAAASDPDCSKTHAADRSDPDAIVASQQQAVAECVEHVLRRLNILTTPPLKKPVQGKARSNSSTPRVLPSLESLQGQGLPELSVHSVHAFDPTLSSVQTAAYHHLRGRLYNVLPDYHPLAEVNLARSVKLQPSCIDAWNDLAECYWKKQDFETAKSCLDMALSQTKNAKSLWMLATTLRKLDKSQAGLERALDLYKNALSLDISNNDAWFGIGMTYLHMGFEVSLSIQELRKSLVAFNRIVGACAGDDALDIELTLMVLAWDGQSAATHNPDVFHNRGLINLTLGNYEAAISDFTRSAALDPLLRKSSHERILSIRDFLKTWHQGIADKGGRPAEWIAQEAARLHKMMPQIRPRGFEDLKRVTLKQLLSHPADEAWAAGTSITLRLIAAMSRGSIELPRSFFVGQDETGQVCGVTILQLKVGGIKTGDLITIAGARIVPLSESDVTVMTVAADEPERMAINGTSIDATATGTDRLSVRVESAVLQ
ncbi:hypothetical protein BC831DRAFT_305095 [Entophlyctis helioformis]|nr:hypothetical protein BC831DRAFT_305095 [Entophlyctis helioformis]